MADEKLTATMNVPIPVGIPGLYCNGFQLGLTNADVNVVLMVDNQPQFNLHLSFTTAKTLSLGLKQTIDHLEEVAGRTIMTSTEIAEAVTRHSATEGQ